MAKFLAPPRPTLEKPDHRPLRWRALLRVQKAAPAHDIRKVGGAVDLVTRQQFPVDRQTLDRDGAVESQLHFGTGRC